jgi:glutathione peroxidase
MKTYLAAVCAALSLAIAAGSGNPRATPSANPKTGAEKAMTPDYFSLPFKTIDGHNASLADFKGKVLLIVNVASKCGHTPQYEGLEKLYEKYQKQGLVVIGFPANNFGGQEPGTNEEIKTFCTTRFHVTFPMMAKVSVKGDDIHPLFGWLTEKSPLPGEIKWNFSKFLLDKNGQLVARYPSAVEPLDTQVTDKITAALKK